MNDLHTLSLNLGGVTRALEPHIIDAIHKDRKWNIASLRFFAPYSNIPKTILEHCQNNTLESLHVYTGESSSEIVTAAEYHPSLKRLHLSVLPNTGTMIASMDFARLKSLSTKFQDLEWLALDEKWSLQRFTPGGYSAVQFVTARTSRRYVSWSSFLNSTEEQEVGRVRRWWLGAETFIRYHPKMDSRLD
ncbi:hypothetical protein AUP68_03208 [Ilyonectria robusta]